PRRPRTRARWTSGPAADTLVLGRYRLRERLGAGGFGVVWSAHDELLHRDVAVKRIALAPEEDGGRASREALASARLAHPAIVALYEACPADDAFYLISELVDGPTLASLIADDELDDEQIVQIGVALCSALEHAHARGVIHRDVKPQNVLVPLDARAPTPASEAVAAVAKLTDFGGARLSGQDALTRTGDVLGTLAYMAPEQCEGRRAAEPADLYSLALVLYEALTGVNPARGATPAETVRRIGRPLPSLARARRDLSRELVRALDRALTRSPPARGTLSQLREALEAELDDTPTNVEAQLPVSPLRRRRPQALDAPPQWSPAPASGAAQPWTDAPLQARSRTAIQTRMPPEAPVPEPLAMARRDPRRGMPRLLWLALAVVLAVWQTTAGRAGVALVLLCALLPIVALPIGRRDRAGTGGWLVCALAPALGAIGLAAAFPAISGQAARWRMRAALGALGYWWLVLAEPLVGRRLWLGPAPSTPARAAWEGSLDTTAVHVIAPVLTTATLLGATLWALAAGLLPLLARGRGAALDVVAASLWSGSLAALAPIAAAGLTPSGAAAAPRGLVVGAALGGAIAIAARALRGPV
ncbi:MAG: eukaryotic-like serine/threonine-protein kinase, partial [Solirubrobacteraceae bacterium]|nr:eukaryotic-like serine/threonine-protein kinase [Solirubrobacteraceae bacterium]